MVSRDEVRRVARLARLALADDEVERLAAELGAILEWAEQLRDLDMELLPEDTVPAPSAAEPARPDDPRPGLARSLVLDLAPAADRDAGTYLVPAVLVAEGAP